MSDIQGALNRLAGITDWRAFVGVQEAANRIAGTQGLATQEALNHATGRTDWRTYVSEYKALVELLDGAVTPPPDGGGGGGTAYALSESFTYADGPLPAPWVAVSGVLGTVTANKMVIVGDSWNAIPFAGKPTRMEFDMEVAAAGTAAPEIWVSMSRPNTNGAWQGCNYYFAGSQLNLWSHGAAATIGAGASYTVPRGTVLRVALTYDRATFTSSLSVDGAVVHSGVVPEDQRIYFEGGGTALLAGFSGNGYPQTTFDNLTVEAV